MHEGREFSFKFNVNWEAVTPITNLLWKLEEFLLQKIWNYKNFPIKIGNSRSRAVIQNTPKYFFMYVDLYP